MLHPYISNVKYIAYYNWVLDFRTYEIIFKNQYVLQNRQGNKQRTYNQKKAFAVGAKTFMELLLVLNATER